MHIKGNIKLSDYKDEIKIHLLLWLSWSGFELLLAEVNGIMQSFHCLCSGPAQLSWSCSAHLAHCDLPHDSSSDMCGGNLLLQAFQGKFSSLFPQEKKKKKTTKYICLRKSQETEQW